MLNYQDKVGDYLEKQRQYVNEIYVLIMQIFWKVLRFKDLNIEVWLWTKVGRVIANSLALPFPSLPSISLSPPSLPLPCSEPPYPWSFYPQTISPHLLYPPPHLVLPLAAGLFLTSLSPPVCLCLYPCFSAQSLAFLSLAKSAFPYVPLTLVAQSLLSALILYVFTLYLALARLLGKVIPYHIQLVSVKVLLLSLS